MLSLDSFLAFLAVAVVVIAVPGAQIAFILGRALALGRRAALATVVGGVLGTLVLVCAVAFGIGSVVARSAVAFSALKWAGAAYLCYLGIRTFRRRRDLVEALATGTPVVSARRALREGFVVGVTNPKTAVFLAAALPQFIDPARGLATVQLLLLGAAFVVVALALDSVWAVAAGTARTWFTRSARRMELIGGAAGLAIAGVGVQLALTGRRDQ